VPPVPLTPPPPPPPVPSPVPGGTVTPAPAPSGTGTTEGQDEGGGVTGEGACPPLTAPGMAGVRCYTRLHPELLPLGLGGGSCLCFILLLGCAAARGRKRRRGRGDSDDIYSETGRDSLDLRDSSFDDSRGRRKRKGSRRNP
jgi:hypothetical protein